MMQPRRLVVARAVPVVLVVALGVTLAACGGGDVALARQACTHVDRSLVLYRRSQATPPPTDAAQLEQEASDQLNVATPLAAEAASENNEWQALMTTLSENNRVSESFLVSALVQQCAQVDSNTPEGSPSTTLPPGSSGPFTTATSVPPGTKIQYGGNDG